MKKYRYIFIIAAVLLLISVCGCAVDAGGVAPAATLDELEQPAIPEKSMDEPPDEPPAQTSTLPP